LDCGFCVYKPLLFILWFLRFM